MASSGRSAHMQCEGRKRQPSQRSPLGPPRARNGRVLESYLGVFTEHYLQAKHQQPVDEADSIHQRLRELMGAKRGV